MLPLIYPKPVFTCVDPDPYLFGLRIRIHKGPEYTGSNLDAVSSTDHIPGDGCLMVEPVLQLIQRVQAQVHVHGLGHVTAHLSTHRKESETSTIVTDSPCFPQYLH